MKGMPMSGLMVRAILNTMPDAWPPRPIHRGLPFKAVTRRIVTPKPTGMVFRRQDGTWSDEREQRIGPRYLPDERVYVGEAWALIEGEKHCPIPNLPHRIVPEGCVVYRDCDFVTSLRWKSGRFLSAKYARLFLKIVSVQAVELRDMTRTEALLEGMHDLPGAGPVQEFSALWRQIHQMASGHTWTDNPWVWRYEFMRLQDEIPF